MYMYTYDDVMTVSTAAASHCNAVLKMFSLVHTAAVRACMNAVPQLVSMGSCIDYCL